MQFNKKIKIGIYCGAIPSTTFIENLICGLSQYFEVHVYGKMNEKTVYKSKNIKVFATPKSETGRVVFLFARLLKLIFFRPLTFLKYFKKIDLSSLSKTDFRNFEKCLPIILHSPDLLHFQWPASLAYFKAITDDFKIIVSLRGSLVNVTPVIHPELMNEYIKNFKNVDAFHSVSKDVKSVSNNLISNDKIIRIIRPAINLEILENSNIVWGYEKNKKVKIITVGRNVWIKGFKYAIDAMRILRDKGFIFEYTIIASGKDEEYINYQISDYKLNEYIKYIPGLANLKVLEEIKNNHIFLLPSLSEGIANVVLESMALGVPVVSTNCGGMPEVLEDGVNGFLVPTRSPEMISEKIEHIMGLDKNKVDKIIFNAKKTITCFHDASIQIKDMKNLYLDTLTRKID
jgi:glycosyltransferase involved in cell wall biosynthesis